MRKLIISNLSILLIAFLIAGNAMSQTDILFGYYLIQDDNAYKSRNKYDELVSTPTVYIGHTYKKENFLIFLL